jgi:hypothetical protein
MVWVYSNVWVYSIVRVYSIVWVYAIVWVYSLRLIKAPLFWEIVVQIILKAIQGHCSMKMKLGCWGR